MEMRIMVGGFVVNFGGGYTCTKNEGDLYTCIW